MGKPTVVEFDTALRHAARLREQGEDIFYMAKTLLNLNYRMKYLVEVLDKAKFYLHSGEGAVAHELLVKAIAEAELASMAAGEEDDKMHPW